MSDAFARVVAGSLSGGLKAQLFKGLSPEKVRTGSIVTIEGHEATFLGVISDIRLQLGSETARSLAKQEEGGSEPMSKSTVKSASKLKSEGSLLSDLDLVALAVSRGDQVEIADSLPDYISFVRTPKQEDVEKFYGLADEKKLWPIGVLKGPLVGREDQTSFVPVNIDVLARGSFGIYGKSGSGKTFLGNILASYITLANYTGELDKKIKLLVLDMHSEYGLKVKDQLGRDYEDGVGLALKDEFIRYTPDKSLAKESGLDPFTISASRITIQDILSIGDALGLSPTFMDLLPTIVRLINEILPKRRWIDILCNYNVDMEIDAKLRDGFRSLGVGAFQSFLAGRNRLERLTQLDFIDWSSDEDSSRTAVDEILKRDKSVIITFGRHGDNRAAYMLVANIISRRLWDECVRMILERKPIDYRVIIFLEEAHKFLSPNAYYMTPFGDIARELRKRGVVLCVLDQRPSEISEEVRAMLWNTFAMWLTEEKDIEVASKGLPFPKLFKPVIENLRRQEVLAFGEAVRIPAVVKVQDYKTTITRLKETYRNIRKKRRQQADAASMQGY
ncbi:MAG: ATP-binding protein [Nitrososphaerales archaeon]